MLSRGRAAGRRAEGGRKPVDHATGRVEDDRRAGGDPRREAVRARPARRAADSRSATVHAARECVRAGAAAGRRAAGARGRGGGRDTGNRHAADRRGLARAGLDEGADRALAAHRRADRDGRERRVARASESRGDRMRDRAAVGAGADDRARVRAVVQRAARRGRARRASAASERSAGRRAGALSGRAAAVRHADPPVRRATARRMRRAAAGFVHRGAVGIGRARWRSRTTRSGSCRSMQPNTICRPVRWRACRCRRRAPTSRSDSCCVPMRSRRRSRGR